MATKVCKTCLKEKAPEGFYFHSETADRLSTSCKECVKARARGWYAKHPQVVKERAKVWAKNHPEKNAARHVRYREKNRGKMNAYYRKSRQALSDAGQCVLHPSKPAVRARLCANCHISLNLRRRLTSALRANVKTGSAVKDLGCSISDFRNYIEALWEPGMSWANYGRAVGKWCFDHIVPFKAFDLSKRENIQKVCHFLNLQPMWFSANCSKGGKF